MKLFTTTLLLLVSMSVTGQAIWNKKLPLAFSPSNNFVDINYKDQRILICSGEKVLELDESGAITAFEDAPSTLWFSNLIRLTKDNNSDDLYFLSGLRKYSNSLAYTIRFKEPNGPVTSEIQLPDSLGHSNLNGPAVLAKDDSTLFVIGHNVAYKVRATGHQGFSILSQKSLTLPSGAVCQAAISVPNGMLGLCYSGHIVGLDTEGEQIFIKNHPVKFYAAVALSDGIIACGSNAMGKAVLVKLDFNGEEIWSKEFDEKVFQHLVIDNNGALLVTGSNVDDKITLLKTDLNGIVFWTQEYQSGNGLRVLPLADGSYFLLAKGDNPTLVYGIKTNKDGTSVNSHSESFVQTRQLKNQDFQVTFQPTAGLFFNNVSPTYFDNEDGIPMVITFSPWIGGFDFDELHIASEKYSQTGFKDFYSGLVDGANGDFGRVWKISKEEISALRKDFLIDHNLDQTPPFDLLTWPARGNPFNQYNIDFTKVNTDPALQPAPFVDVNLDGMYNVYDGDYPIIKGDQMTYWFVNDDSTHINSQGNPLKVDMSISAYLYDCPQNNGVSNSLFVDYELINRSATNYENTYLGFYADFDIGCYLDDNIGSIPEANSFYGYNKDGLDSCSFTQGFGTDIPVQTITFQNQELNHFISFVNNISNPNPVQADPANDVEHYNLLQGKWREGSPLTTGNTGYNPGSTDYANHMFPGNPADPQSWSMCTVVDQPNTDRRALGTHGPFTFAQHDTFRISIAFTRHDHIPHPCPDISGLVKPTVEQLTEWSVNGTLELSPNLGVVQEILGNPIVLGTDIPGATYQWSTGATTPTITTDFPGDYSVTLTNEAGCEVVEHVLVKLGASTNNLMNPTNWQVYPNPALDHIQVDCSDCDQGKEIRALIRNAQGVILRQDILRQLNAEISLSGMSSGLYWLELWQGNQFLGTRKFTHFEH